MTAINRRRLTMVDTHISRPLLLLPDSSIQSFPKQDNRLAANPRGRQWTAEPPKR